MENISTLTDKDLLALCQKYGSEAILWRRKFIGLLPEVDRRGLYEKKKCSSIYEFAAKFGGVTKKHTQRVIQIDKAFEEKDVKVLREMLQEGAVSISKLIKVVSVASIENEPDIVFAVKNLSHESLETYVRDMRRKSGSGRNGETDGFAGGNVSMFEDESFSVEVGDLSNGGDMVGEKGDGLFEPSDHPKSVRPNTFEGSEKMGTAEVGGEFEIEREGAGGTGTNEIKMQNPAVALKKLQLNLSGEMLDELLELQRKGINIDNLLREFLQNREENIAEQKEETVKKVTGREEKRKEEGKKPVRKISVEVKRVLEEEYGTKCSVGGCNKAADHLHHTVPFSINGSNSPDLLKPLCRAHHDIVHSVNERYLEKKGIG